MSCYGCPTVNRPIWVAKAKELSFCSGDCRKEGGSLLSGTSSQDSAQQSSLPMQYDFLYPTFAEPLQAGLRLGSGLCGIDPPLVSPLFERLDHRSWLAAQASA